MAFTGHIRNVGTRYEALVVLQSPPQDRRFSPIPCMHGFMDWADVATL